MRWASPLAAEIGSWSVSLKIGAGLMALIVLAGLLAPWIAPYDPFYQDFAAALLPPGLAHPFGTDSLGRDIFSRVLHGLRIDLTIGLISTYVPMASAFAACAYAAFSSRR